MTYSQQLFRRALFGVLAIGSLVLIVTLVYWSADYSKDEATGIFFPKERVNRIIRLDNQLRAFESEQPPIVLTGKVLACNSRSTAVLQERLLTYFRSGALVTDRLIDQLLGSEVALEVNTCRDLIQDIELLSRIKENANTRQPTPTFEMVRQHLVERLQWRYPPTCLSVRLPRSVSETEVLAGNPTKCAPVSGVLSRDAVRDDLMKIGFPIYQLLRHTSQSREAGTEKFIISPHPDIQYPLTDIKKCFGSILACPGVPFAQQVDSFSIVILRAADSSVLGFTCWGEKCSNRNIPTVGSQSDWSSLNLLAPPASTTKLFYALAIAAHGRSPALELERQIKTSGQLDGKVRKRNEWWERRSICDSSKNSVDPECPLASYAHSLATRFGWNNSCESPNNNQCGRHLLISVPNLTGVPSYIGTFGDGRYLKSSTGPYLRWDHYDKIRQGKELTSPRDRKSLERTSATIQSVIGGGDSRVSALGLAQTMASFYQITSRTPISKPSILLSELKSVDSTTLAAQLDPPQIQTVLRGLEKVMEPAEKGWEGDGTAHPAVRRIFGTSCVNNCGLAGKTGTVSSADPRYSGVTLFMGLADLSRIAKTFGLSSSTPFDKIAIGVIVYPQSKRTSTDHFASHLAMLAIRSLLDKQNAENNK